MEGLGIDDTITTGADTIILGNENKSTNTKTPNEVVSYNKPKQHTVQVEIVSVSNEIASKTGGKPYHVVNYIADDKEQITTVSSGLKYLVKDLEASVGKGANLTFESTIADKTEYVDTTTGDILTHTTTGMRLVRISACTKSQQNLAETRAKFGLMTELRLENKIAEAGAEDKLALATLYGSMMR